MAVSPKTRLLAVPTVALMSLALLAGCGSSDKKESVAAETSSSASASAEQSQAAEETSSAAADEAKVEAVIPDGFKKVTAPNNKISFAVPEGWMEMDSEAIANTDAIQEYLDQAAQGTNFTPEELKSQMAQLDLMATSVTPNEDGFAENVNVNAEPVLVTSLPDQAEMESLAKGINATPGEYKKISTPLGEGTQLSYTLDVTGVSVHGVFVVVPSGTGTGFSVLTVSSSNADSAAKLAEQMAGSLSKAS
ncbi:hypothetical protein [Rothia sp. CCM 9416]|uniref:hypothetical protein n=1 Tax=Rothia sp. CCM 9416 TaxID=3402655 RepID=UPI003AE8227E